jgi:hypothetical protein
MEKYDGDFISPIQKNVAAILEAVSKFWIRPDNKAKSVSKA